MTFFQSISDTIDMIFTWFVNFIDSLQQLFQFATSAVALPPLLQNFLPSILGTCIYTVVLCGVIKFIFGR